MKLKNSGDLKNVMIMVKNRTKRNGKPGFIKLHSLFNLLATRSKCGPSLMQGIHLGLSRDFLQLYRISLKSEEDKS
jgi:hypothetical protein